MPENIKQVNLKTLMIEGSYENFNGPNKLKKIIFKNIVPMKVSAVFEYNSNNSYSADNNQILSKMLVKIAG